MPSISQAKLDELVAAHDSALRQATDSQQRALRAEERLAEFDRILDKVVRAAEGRPLLDARNLQGDRGYYMGESRLEGQKIKRSERQDQEIKALNDVVAHLQARLAAVVAVATFAQAHKA